jgi:hypothetical protein
MSIPMSAVQAAVAKHYGVHVADLTAQRKKQPIVTYRQVAMAVALDLCGLSPAAVGKHFGGRDRTTVLHARRVVAAAPDLSELARSLGAELRRQHAQVVDATPFKHRPLPPSHVHRVSTTRKTPKERLKSLQAQNDGMGRAAPITLPKFPWEP